MAWQSQDWGRQEFILLPVGTQRAGGSIEVTEKGEPGAESYHDQPRMALSLAGKVGVKVTGPSALLWEFIKSRAVTCGFTRTSEDNEGKRRGWRMNPSVTLLSDKAAHKHMG